MKTGLFFLLALLVMFPCFSAVRTAEKGTPFFRTPELTEHPFAIAQEPVELESSETKLFRITRHPLSWRVSMHAAVMGNEVLWMPENLKAIPLPGGQYRYEFNHLSLKVPVGTVLILLGLLALIRGWNGEKHRVILFGSSILLIRIGWVLVSAGLSGFIPSPRDEVVYFQVAEDLAKGNFAGPWRYTVGYPLLESLLIRLFRPASFDDYEMVQIAVNGLILFPAALLFLWFSLRKILGSEKKAVVSLLLFQILSIFWQFRDFWHTDEARWGDNIYKAFFALPDTGFSYPYYISTAWTGWNALSEPFSCFCLFGLLAYLLYFRHDGKRIFLFAFLYGFCCMIRINNILFAPVFLFLIFQKREKSLLQVLSAGAAGFLTGFLPQFLFNTLHFGNPLTFPYVLHDAMVGQGFRLHYLPWGIRFLFSVNYAWFFLGLAGLLLTEDRKQRVILCLWYFPLVFFFLGFPQIGNHGVRFILPALIMFPAALAGCRLWNGTKRETVFLILFFAVLMLPVSPVFRSYEAFLPWNMQKIPHGAEIAFFLNFASPAAALVIAFLGFFRKRKTFLLLVVLTAVYSAGSVWILFAGMVLSGIRAAADVVILLKERNGGFSRNPQEEHRS